ncbi:MAG: isochorismatase family protein [Bacteroidetes bacterium]|nr:isochorismatase family protein [Bacteroidota bacterium]
MKEKYFTDESIASESRELIKEVISYSGKRSFVPDKKHIALVVVDMQNYFLLPDEHAYIPSAPAIISNVISIMETCHIQGIPVFMSRHLNTPEDAGMMGVRWEELIKESDSRSEIHPDILKAGGTLINKTQFDAFYGTNFETELRNAGIRQLIITGVMTNLCCETTARSAFVRGFEVVMPVDATASYNLEFHLATFLNLAYIFSAPLMTKTLISFLNGGK